MYTEAQHAAAKERTLDALDAIYQIREQYKDVIAIPEVITLHDITEYRVEHEGAIRQFKTVFDKKAAEFVLDYFHGTDYLSPEIFENTILDAITAYSQKSRHPSG
jgi:restriction endonuclease Mrr